MPLAQITIVEGRSPEKVALLADKVTQAIAEAIDAPVQNVRVVITECPADRWFVGGQSIAARDRAPG